MRHPDKVFGSAKFRPAIGGEAVIYSNDNSQVISGGDDGAIRFFDASSGEIKNVIASHYDEVSELARIPGAEVLISSGISSAGFETKFWDMQTSCELMRLKGGGRGLSVSPNGRWLFTGDHLWEIESINPLRLAAQGRGYPQDVTISWSFFTPDNRYLIFGVQNSYAYIWNLENDFVRRIGNMKVDELQSLTWGDLEGIVDVPASSRDDLLALATSQYTILTSDPKTLRAFEPVLKKAGVGAMSLACSPDGRYLAAIGFRSRIDIYDRSRGGQKLALDGHTHGLQAVAASPDGQLIVSGGHKTVRLWDRESGEQLKLIETASSVWSLCFSPDGKQLAIGDEVGGVYVYDFAARELKKWQAEGRMTSVMFDNQGETLFALGPNLTVFDPRTGEQLASAFSEKAQQGSLAAIPPDLILGSGDGVTAWSYQDKQLIDRSDQLPAAKRGRGSRRVAVAPNGSTLAVGSIAIQFWDFAKQERIGDLMLGHTYHVEDMKFSPDGKLLASGGGGVRDGTTRIWEVPTGRLLMVLDADVNRVNSVAFLPDGSLVTANWNGTVHLWDLPKHLSGK